MANTVPEPPEVHWSMKILRNNRLFLATETGMHNMFLQGRFQK